MNYTMVDLEQGKRAFEYMVKLKHIERKNDIITCDAYVEDCKHPINLTLNIRTKTFECAVLPNGYEWCRAHIGYAERALLAMFESGTMQEEKTIMWY